MRPAGLPVSAKNYMTPEGFARMREELDTLMRKERPEVVKVVSLGGRQRRPLGERRLYLRQEAPARDRPPHPLSQQAAGQCRGGRPGQARQDRPGVLRRHRHLRQRQRARSARSRSSASTRSISTSGHVSWISPIAKALLRAEEGDVVKLRTPAGVEEIEIVKVGIPLSCRQKLPAALTGPRWPSLGSRSRRSAVRATQDKPREETLADAASTRGVTCHAAA